MKVQELRIGNLILADFDGKGNFQQIIVAGINESGCIQASLCEKQNSRLDEHWEDNLTGIILTSEYLLKLGFQKDTVEHLYYRKHAVQYDFFVFSNKTPVAIANNIESPFYYIINGIIKSLDTVHQLQNLFFAVTGEELNNN